VVRNENRPGEEIVRTHLGKKRVMPIRFWVLYGARRKRHRMDDLVSNFAKALKLLEHLSRQAVSRAENVPVSPPRDREEDVVIAGKRLLDSLLNLITDLVADGLLFFCLLFRSRTALSVEVLFLLKQLAFYQGRQVQPKRLNDSARFSLILLSRLCNWKEALVIVKPEIWV
jgi:hypothetical protein